LNFQQHAAIVKYVLKQNLDPAISIFDKIKIQQNGTSLMLECLNQVNQTIKAHFQTLKILKL